MHLIFVFLFELYLFFEKIEEVLFTFRLVSRNRVKLHSSGTNCHFKWLPTEQFTDCDVLITIKYFPELSFVTLFWEILGNPEKSFEILGNAALGNLRQRITIPTVQS